MATNLTDTQLTRWRVLNEEASRDSDWVTSNNERDARRLVIQRQILDLLHLYLAGKVTIEDFRSTFDRRTKTDWDVFGFKGMSGAMFLNMLVKNIPDREGVTEHLRAALEVPRDAPSGRQQMKKFLDALEGYIASGKVEKQQVHPGRTPFFLSAWWHIQDNEKWPVFYISAREVLEREGLYTSVDDPVEDYFAFRESFHALGAALGLKAWSLEYLCAWHEEGDIEDSSTTRSAPATHSLPEVEPGDSTEHEAVLPAEGKLLHTHSQIQWTLATMGRKLGCDIWIAANDQSREWNGKRLGSLSLPELPGLGMDEESLRLIRLIDVLWLKNRRQVAAAFEVEHTSSVYSGLLRLTDLITQSPNLNFPLYIITPEERLGQVNRELLRPTFRSLELHKRCGFFSEEALVREAPNIMRWGSDPSAIGKLAMRITG